ncbi:uncharacterized protein LOC141607942 [Silene latifolia]|uniref:uncharacterized protein LOC141607942 n=1 Tax=Silene latifolia TaxID=37657 RepID=UPI003D770D9C
MFGGLMKADNLWVKWVHSIYIKQTNWADYEPTFSASWAWRRICAVKDQLKPWMFDDQWRQTNNDYTVKLGYLWLVDDGIDVTWYPWVKNRLILPKHNFFIWLVAQNHLLTYDRLLRMNIAHCNRCLLCDDGEENIDHLFFQCSFSKQCVRLLEDWLQVCLPMHGVIDWWVHLMERSLMMKQVVAAALAHMMYLIWHARNRCRLEYVLPSPVVLFK